MNERHEDADQAQRSCSTDYSVCATVPAVKDYIHARLGPSDRTLLDELRRTTGASESDLVRRGLQLVAKEERRRHSALTIAGPSVGRFAGGARDLSANRKHLDGFGE
jgi:Arc/MetJ-type ribon-helix-helix transcriptional regulator